VSLHLVRAPPTISKCRRSSKSDLPFDFGHERRGLDVQNPRDFDEFEDIDLALTGLGLPDEGVRSFELCGQLPLSQSGGLVKRSTIEYRERRRKRGRRIHAYR
jgi:hypothetical protein